MTGKSPSQRMRIAGSLLWVMIAGMGGVRVIKALREHARGSEGSSADFLGYGPNLVAAITLPFFFYGMTVMSTGNKGDDAYSWSHLWRERAAIWMGLLVSQTGLLGWEFLQPRLPNRTFDTQDLWATVAGGVIFLTIVGIARALTAPGRGRDLPSNTLEHEAP